MEIYFSGQIPDDPDYYPITILEVEGQKGASPYNALILMIQDLAQKEGIDAVLLNGREFRTMGCEGNMGSYPVLSWVGIKYVRNITCLHTYVNVKAEKCSVPGSQGKRAAMTTRYSLEGQQEGLEMIKPDDHRCPQNYLSQYSLDHHYDQIRRIIGREKP